MNLSVKPGDDFVEYSNGIWVKNNPIPAKETRWGSFNEIRDFNIKAVKIILDETVAKQKSLTKGSVERRVADFYAASMDSLRIESLGFDPIKSDLKINATPIPRDEYQMWSYASINAPQSFNPETCMRPEKF
jgi:putative endopeptidase